MGGFSGNVADLHANLILDSERFSANLAQAQADFVKAAEVVKAQSATMGQLVEAVYAKVGQAAIDSAVAQARAGESVRDVLVRMAIANDAFASSSSISSAAALLESKSFTALSTEINKATTAATAFRRVSAPPVSFSSSFAKSQAGGGETDEAMLRRVLTQAGYVAGGYEGGRTVGLLTLPGAGALTGVAAGALAIGAATYEVSKWTVEAAKAARATENLSEQLGITWQQARRLQEMANIAGVNITTLQQASGRLANALEGTTGAGRLAAKALHDIGIEGGSSSGQILFQFLEKLSTISDVTERIRLAREVFGRASYEFLPIVSNMDRLKELVKSLGPLISENVAGELSKVAETISLAETAWARFKQSLAEKLSPIVVTVSTVLTGFLAPEPDTPGKQEIGSQRRKETQRYGPQAMAELRKIQQGQLDEQQRVQKEVDQAGKNYQDFLDTQLRDSAKKRLAILAQSTEFEEAELTRTKNAIKEIQSELVRGADLTHFGKPLAEGDVQAKKDELKRLASERDRLEASIAEAKAMTPAEVSRRASAELDTEISYRRKMADIQLQSIQSDIRTRRESIASETDFLHHRETLTEEELRNAVSRVDKLAGLDYEELEAARDANDKAYTDEVNTANKKAELERGAGKNRLDAEVALRRQLSDLKAAWLAKDSQITNQENERLAKEARDISRITSEFTDERERRENAFLDRAAAMARQEADDKVRASQISIESIMQHETRLLEFRREGDRFLEEEGRISIAERIRRERAAVDEEISLQRMALQARAALEEDKSAAGDITAASRLAGIKRELLALEDRRLLSLQRLNEEEAKGVTMAQQALTAAQAALRKQRFEGDTSDLVRQIEYVKIRTDALRLSQEGVGRVWVTTLEAAREGFGRFGSSIAGAIMDAKDLTAAWKGALHQIETQILGSTLDAALKLVASKIFLKNQETAAVIKSDVEQADSAITAAKAEAMAQTDTTASVASDYVSMVGAAKASWTGQVTAAAWGTRSIVALSHWMRDNVVSDYAAMTQASYRFWEEQRIQAQQSGGLFEALANVFGTLAGGIGGATGGAAGAGGGASGAVPVESVTSVIHYAGGGDVMRNSMAIVHEGEHILNPDISAELRRSMSQGTFGGGVTVSLVNPVFHGVPSPELINPFMNAVIAKLRSARIPGY